MAAHFNQVVMIVSAILHFVVGILLISLASYISADEWEYGIFIEDLQVNPRWVWGYSYIVIWVCWVLSWIIAAVQGKAATEEEQEGPYEAESIALHDDDSMHGKQLYDATAANELAT